MTYENQAQVEAHESPRGRRLPWQLRCATKRDDGQVTSATDDGHTPPAGTPGSGGTRVAGVCWAGHRHASLVRRMEFSGGTGTVVFNHGETDMGDKGSKDKGKREEQKKAQLSPKEKRKLKKEKKNK